MSWSGQQDLNLRPSGPKPDALPDCAMPRLELAHILVGEPVSSPDQVRAKLSPGYALRREPSIHASHFVSKAHGPRGRAKGVGASNRARVSNRKPSPDPLKPPSMARRSVRRRPEPGTLRPHLGRHQAFRAGPETDQDELARPQLGDAVAA